MLSPAARRDLLACLLCVAVSVSLAIAPHLAAWAHSGSPEFLADNDDVFYLAVSRAPYYGEWAMRDGFLPPREKAADLHSWAEFVPLAKAVRLVQIPLIYLTAVWRVLGAALLAVALYWLFRRLFAHTSRPVAWALGCTLICLCDAGFCDGRSLIEDARLLPYFRHGNTPINKPDALPQFRVVTPLLDLPFLILMAAALAPSKGKWKRNAILAGVFLGCCVLLYFYLWTAAVAALCGYFTVLTIMHRRATGQWLPLPERAKAIVLTVALGLAIGAPQIYYGTTVTRDPQMKPYLERSGRPAHLDAGDPERGKNKVNFWVWGKLALGAVAVLVLAVPGIGLLWWLVLAGYALSNLALFTGLEFENTHWVLVHAPFGEILILATLVAVLERMSRPALRLAWVIPAALLVFAALWRPYESLHAPTSVRMDTALRELRPLRASLGSLDRDRTLAGPWQSQVAILYSRSALLFNEPYTPLLLIPMREVNQRHVLNAWLQGLDGAAYRASPSLGLTVTAFGTGRPDWNPEIVARDRLALFKDLLEQPGAGDRLVHDLGVTDLLLPASAAAPTRGGPWSLTGKSEAWSLWTRVRPG